MLEKSLLTHNETVSDGRIKLESDLIMQIIWRCQLTALAKRDHRGPDTVVQGAVLHACLDIFILEPRDRPVALEVSHDSSPSPVLLSWFRSFQTSCT